jgi:DUF1680 family protein
MGPIDLTRSPHALLQPTEGRIEAGFWADRQKLNRERLLLDGEHWLEEAGNFENLRAAAGRSDAEFRGMVFMDSDVHKWLEALGWELGREPSEDLAHRADQAIELVEAAQEGSGYLNSYYQVAKPGPRFTNLAWNHELYCAGHLTQAAIAHARGRGDDRLLGVARRFTDHIGEVFSGRDGTPGHPEIETALVELYRHTGERRYLDLAAYFVGTRGRSTLQPARFGSSYFQDHVPVREATEVTGHAVRALYLAAGVTDLWLETGEAALMDVMREQWRDMSGRKSYVTGGVGAHHSDEAFGDPFELPPDRCYGETCAAIASVMWSWRMLLATGDARYADSMERTLYNGFLSGLALDGGGYSYVNPLHVRDDHRDAVERGARRLPWYACACCPPNVMRTLASLQHYLATRDAGGVQVHHYASGTVGPLRIATDYPWHGRVEIEVTEAGEWTLSLRIPAWAEGAAVDGEPAPAGGYARVHRSWSPGDTVTLELPLAPRLTAPHPRIDAVRGCLAIERGPLVYCVEGADTPAGVRTDDLRLDPGAPLRDVERSDLLGSIVAVEAEGARASADAWDPDWAYAPAAAPGHAASGHAASGHPTSGHPTSGHSTTGCSEVGGSGGEVRLVAVPYALWGNRGDGPMRVWIPTAG